MVTGMASVTVTFLAQEILAFRASGHVPATSLYVDRSKTRGPAKPVSSDGFNPGYAFLTLQPAGRLVHTVPYGTDLPG